MLGDVEVDDGPAMVGEHDEDEEDAPGRSGDGEDNRCPDVVGEERAPSRGRRGCVACLGWNFWRPGAGSFRPGWGLVRPRRPNPATDRRPADESTSVPQGEDDHQGTGKARYGTRLIGLKTCGLGLTKRRSVPRNAASRPSRSTTRPGSRPGPRSPSTIASCRAPIRSQSGSLRPLNGSSLAGSTARRAKPGPRTSSSGTSQRSPRRTFGCGSTRPTAGTLPSGTRKPP